MKMLSNKLHVGWLAILLAFATVTTATAAEIVVVNDTVITTQAGSKWKTLNVSNGAGISDVCAAGFAAGANWRECYSEFVPVNEAAGNPMYIGPDGLMRLFANQNYIGPEPIKVNTPAEAAALVRLGDLLERATDAELAQLREAVDATGGNIAMLASRLDEFEARLAAVEEENRQQAEQIADIEQVNANQSEQIAGVEQVNGEQANQISDIVSINDSQTNRLNDIDGFIDPIKAELDGQTLTEFVDGRIPAAQPVVADEVAGNSLWLRLMALIALLLALAALISVLVLGRRKADHSDLEDLKGKVGDRKTGLAAVHTKADDALARIDEVRAGLEAVIEVDAAGRLNAPGFTEDTLKNLGDDPFELTMPGKGAARKKVLVYNRGDYVELVGLASGHDRVGKVGVIAIYRHITKALRPENNWVQGATASKAA